jgi:DNA processing protein
MSNELDFLWFKLFSTPGIGYKTISIIYEIMKKNNLSIKDIFSLKNDEITDLIIKHSGNRLKNKKFNINQSLDSEIIYMKYQKVKEKGVKIIYPGHELLFDSILKISPILFYKGNISLLKANSIAIAGSRNASNKGLEIARYIAKELAKHGKNIISGYAKGIDTNAHSGALEVDGTTTIVLSYGILEFKIKSNLKDFNWINNTLIVSQFFPEEKWSSKNAMMRNKLIAFLSKGLIIIESGQEKDENEKMSGTFNTGKVALENNIPLFVLSPKCFQNPPSGNEKLIKLGGIEITLENGIERILDYIKKEKEYYKINQNEQLSFFREDEK